MKLNWTTGLFSSTYKLKENGESIGHLKVNPWISKAEGLIHEQKLLFKSRGAFSSTVDIFDLHTGKRIGEMKSKSFSSTKILNLENEKPLFLVPKGIFSNKWFLKSKDEAFIEINAKETKGEMKAIGPVNDVMVLSGLYGINQYYVEYIAAAVAAAVAAMMAN